MYGTKRTGHKKTTGEIVVKSDKTLPFPSLFIGLETWGGVDNR
jgi:hypothetical protein